MRRSSRRLSLALSSSLTSMVGLRLAIAGLPDGADPESRPWSEKRVRLLESAWSAAAGLSPYGRGEVLAASRQEWHMIPCESQGTPVAPLAHRGPDGLRVGGEDLCCVDALEPAHPLWHVSV